MLRKRLSKNGNLFLIKRCVVTLVDPVFIFKETYFGKVKACVGRYVRIRLQRECQKRKSEVTIRCPHHVFSTNDGH